MRSSIELIDVTSSRRGISITFETNGTIEIDFDRYPAYRDAIFALSIKLSNSGEPFRKRVNLKAIERIVSSAKESFFKFTIPERACGYDCSRGDRDGDLWL